MATVKDASPVRAVRLLTRICFRHCKLDGQSSDLVLNLNPGVPHNEVVILREVADEMERQSVWRVGDVASPQIQHTAPQPLPRVTGNTQTNSSLESSNTQGQRVTISRS